MNGDTAGYSSNDNYRKFTSNPNKDNTIAHKMDR